MWGGGGAGYNLSPGAGHGSGGGAYGKIRYQICAGDSFEILLGMGGDPIASDPSLRDGGWAEVKKKVGTEITNEYGVEGGKGADAVDPGTGGLQFIEDTYIGGLPATVIFSAIGGNGGYATDPMGTTILTTGDLEIPGARGGGGGGAGGPVGSGMNGIGPMGGMSFGGGSGGNGGAMDGQNGQDGLMPGGGGGGRAFSIGDVALNGRGGNGMVTWCYDSPCVSQGGEISLIIPAYSYMPSVVSAYYDNTTEPTIPTLNFSPGFPECEGSTQVNLVEIMRILSGLSEESFQFEGEFEGLGVSGVCLDPFSPDIPPGTNQITILFRYNCGLDDVEFSCEFTLHIRDVIIEDPCACDDPQNVVEEDGTVSLFHDVISLTGFLDGAMVSVSQVLSGNDNVFLNPGMDPVVGGTPLVEDPAGSGNYYLDIWRLPGTDFSMEFEILLSSDSDPILVEREFPLCLEATDCIVRPIPVMGTWTLAILMILLSILGIVLLKNIKPVLRVK